MDSKDNPRDYSRQRLAARGDAAKMDAILQAECRDRCADKLRRTLAADPGFRFPSLAVAQMATADDVAAVHAGWVEPGQTVLDMTCGLGVDALHMARAGARVTAIDIDPDTAREAAHNARLTPGLEVACADSVEWLQGCGRRFDVIFIDPARRDASGRHYSLAECRPDVTACLPLLLSRCDRLIVKASPMLDPTALARELGHGADIKITGTARECKEVAAIVPGTGTVECVTTGAGHAPWLFTPAQEREALATWAEPEAGGVLLLPWPAVMKGGSYRLLSSRLGVGALHPMSHLYYSPTPRPDFPGRQLEIIRVLAFDKAAIRGFAGAWPEINVAARNFPLTAPQLAARLRVREGGDMRLIATTLRDGRKVMAVCKELKGTGGAAPTA